MGFSDEMTDRGEIWPQLIRPTGLGEDFPTVKLLELARTSAKNSFIATELDQELETYVPESIPVTNEEKLFPKTPIVNVTSAAEAFSDQVLPKAIISLNMKYCGQNGVNLRIFSDNLKNFSLSRQNKNFDHKLNRCSGQNRISITVRFTKTHSISQKFISVNSFEKSSFLPKIF